MCHGPIGHLAAVILAAVILGAGLARRARAAGAGGGRGLARRAAGAHGGRRAAGGYG
jgi:hypothetical protein